MPYWRCELPGGTYEVAIRAIISVSSHEYIVDGAARVNEVNVDTQGNMAVRFYFLEPTAAKSPVGVGQSAIDRISDLAKEAGQRVGADQVWKRVVKTYPTTTHAHSVEYRVESEEQLKQIFSSAQGAFESGVTATFKTRISAESDRARSWPHPPACPWSFAKARSPRPRAIASSGLHADVRPGRLPAPASNNNRRARR